MLNRQNNEYKCRICGHDNKTIRWKNFDQELIPLYIICPCCGGEAGLDDSWLDGIKSYREKWKNSGYKWKYEKDKPQNWNLEAQLAQIPEEYK